MGAGLTSPSPNINSSTLHIDASNQGSQLTLNNNSLEQKLLKLDILEDKQDEIQKILMKKQKYQN